MKIKRSFLAVLVVAGLPALFLLAGCSGSGAQTDPATNVTNNSATLNGHVACPTGDGSVSFWWRWRKDTGPWQESSHASAPCQGLDNDVGTQYQLSGLEPGSHYQFEGCSQPGDYPICVNADGEAGIVFPGQDGPGEPIDSFDTKSPSNLVPVDGGPDYYARFSHGLPTSRSYFPIGVWLESVLSKADVDKDKDAGLNLYVGLTANSDVNLVRDNGMQAILQQSEWRNDTAAQANPAVVGWELYDEVDMQLGPGAGYDAMNDVLASLPQDGRTRYNNYGKGIMFWETDQEAQRFVNEFQDLTAFDIYWFTDPHVSGIGEGGYFFGLNRSLTDDETRRASNYGATVDRVRYLDGLDGIRHPIWSWIELGWPFTETAAQGARAIEPAEIRAAVWQSIIAGARGIGYFNHSFGGPCPTQHALREPCYAPERAMVASVNAQITRLAPVLNSPSAPSWGSVSPGIRTMTKVYNGTYYIFADSSDGNGHDATFTVPSGTVATVEGENRTIPITNGSFTDNFADGNAIHIYRIDD